MNVGPPYALGIPIRSTPDLLDFTTVLSVHMYVERPDGTSPSLWSAILVAAPGQQAVTPTLAMAQYPFVLGDLSMRGVWRVQVQLGVPGGGTWFNKPEATPEFLVTNQWGQ